MKELSIEQKAKAYDEAIGKLQGLIDNANKQGHIIVRVKDIENTFPELKESEDERIRKVLAGFFKSYKEQGTCGAETFNGIPTENILAWLEKQEPNPYGGVSFNFNDHAWGMCARDGGVEILIDGNLKAFISSDKSFVYPTNNPEPKFHEGEWLTENHPNSYARFVQILEVVNVQGENKYRISRDLHDDEDVTDCLFIEDHWHPFNIQDAKDGDVLACNGEILLFKSYSVQRRISLYCWYNGQTNNFHNKEVVDVLLTTRNKVCPATKEQRELLFSKMKEAGYEWDADKKELKIVDWSKHIKYNPDAPSITEEKPVWTEADERIRKSIYYALKYLEEKLSWDFLDDVDILDAYEWLEKLSNKV